MMMRHIDAEFISREQNVQGYQLHQQAPHKKYAGILYTTRRGDKCDESDEGREACSHATI